MKGTVMQRRQFLWVATTTATAAAGLAPIVAWAHHGWSSFDQDKPIYLEGRAERVAWRNPHAELQLRTATDLKLPADLATRPVPAQSASVDSDRVLRAARLPTRKDTLWQVELAPLTRMQAWRVAEIKPGQAIAVVGYTLAGEQGEAVVRVEYLFVDGRGYGLRSAPA